jgi:hypothetical protein
MFTYKMRAAGMYVEIVNSFIVSWELMTIGD